MADPIVGLVISAAIVVIVWQSGRSVPLRVLDGVESGTLERITHAAGHVAHVEEVTDVRARWIGHRLHADVSGAAAGNVMALHNGQTARYCPTWAVMVHVDPYGQGGEQHNRVGPHSTDDLPLHPHD